MRPHRPHRLRAGPAHRVCPSAPPLTATRAPCAEVRVGAGMMAEGHPCSLPLLPMFSPLEVDAGHGADSGPGGQILCFGDQIRPPRDRIYAAGEAWAPRCGCPLLRRAGPGWPLLAAARHQEGAHHCVGVHAFVSPPGLRGCGRRPSEADALPDATRSYAS